jgi:hypothetical protein
VSQQVPWFGRTDDGVGCRNGVGTTPDVAMFSVFLPRVLLSSFGLFGGGAGGYVCQPPKRKKHGSLFVIRATNERTDPRTDGGRRR